MLVHQYLIVLVQLDVHFPKEDCVARNTQNATTPPPPLSATPRLQRLEESHLSKQRKRNSSNSRSEMATFASKLSLQSTFAICTSCFPSEFLHNEHSNWVSPSPPSVRCDQGLQADPKDSTRHADLTRDQELDWIFHGGKGLLSYGYTVQGDSMPLKQLQLQFAVYNLFNSII